jgi:hypothetical protein
MTMATQTTAHRAALAAPTTFERLAGLCGITTGIAGFMYAVAFLLLRNNLLSALFLLLAGLLSTTALVALYSRLRETDVAFALWALLFSVAGALGSVIHGGYDLATTLHPVASAALPSPIDPRGLLTFGVAGLGLGAFASLIGRSRHFPQGLGSLGYVLAILLVVLYLARLLVVDVKSPAVVLPAVVSGFLINPAWYIWLGLALWRGSTAAQTGP